MTTDGKIKDEKLQYDINREAAKISALSSGKIDKYEFLTGEETLPPDQRRVIEQGKFAYSPLGKVFEKQAKTIDDQDKKQIKALQEHWKQLAESNELVKKDFNIDRDSKPFDEQRKIFNELIEERFFKFRDLEKRINPNNLIYKCKNEEISPKEFRNYQNPIELFKDLRDGDINPKVLKYQINFKSDLGEIKKGNKKSKPKDQISVIQTVQNFFDLREKFTDFFFRLFVFAI